MTPQHQLYYDIATRRLSRLCRPNKHRHPCVLTRFSCELSPLPLQQDPPPGIAPSLWRAEIVEPPNSPFQGCVFELVIKFPPRYPMQPPNCRFASNPAPYHPNIIDSSDRISFGHVVYGRFGVQPYPFPVCC